MLGSKPFKVNYEGDSIALCGRMSAYLFTQKVHGTNKVVEFILVVLPDLIVRPPSVTRR